jgi:hypothetical protein
MVIPKWHLSHLQRDQQGKCNRISTPHFRHLFVILTSSSGQSWNHLQSRDKSVEAGQTCRRTGRVKIRIPLRKPKPIRYLVRPMVACITTFVLHPRTSGTRIPRLTNSDVEDPRNFVNPEQEIIDIAAYGIQQNAVWDSVLSQRDGYTPRSAEPRPLSETRHSLRIWCQIFWPASKW